MTQASGHVATRSKPVTLGCTGILLEDWSCTTHTCPFTFLFFHCVQQVCEYERRREVGQGKETMMVSGRFWLDLNPKPVDASRA